LAYFLSSDNCKTYFFNSLTGTTIHNLSLETIRATKVPFPPLDEQGHIIDCLHKETARLDALTTEATRAIALLKERRSALISAAVTGKIDVREPA
jgi:type I restriction enzyme S subunit